MARTKKVAPNISTADKVNKLTRRELLEGIGFGVGAAALGLHEASAQVRQGQRFTIQARPEPITIDPATTAVIVVDMQNDFGSKGGMFERAGIDISGIQRAVAPTKATLEAARKARIHVVYLKMAYLPDLSDLGTPDSVNRARHLRLGVGNAVTAPDGKPSRILIRDTWNSDIIDELKPRAGDSVVYKTRFSGFYKTDLEARLNKRRVKHLIITGCTTSICVESTVRDAMFRDFSCVLLADCMNEPIGNGLTRSNHDASLLSTEILLGWVSDSASFISAVSS